MIPTKAESVTYTSRSAYRKKTRITTAKENLHCAIPAELYNVCEISSLTADVTTLETEHIWLQIEKQLHGSITRDKA